MGFELAAFNDPQLDAEYVAHLADRQADAQSAHYGRLWDYYRNPLTPAPAGAAGGNARPYVQAQEAGLPARITGVRRAGSRPLTDVARKEVVIENDIAWRIDTMTDFLFGKAPSIRSLSADQAVAEAVDAVIAAMFDANGGDAFFQEMALYGGVYGLVDIALRTPADGGTDAPQAIPQPVSRSHSAESTAADRRPGQFEDNQEGMDPRRAWSRNNLRHAVAAARRIRLETIEAPRVLPILAEDDYRTVRYWMQRYYKRPPRMSGGRLGWLRSPWSPRGGRAQAAVEVVEIVGPRWWQRYEDRRLTGQGANPLGQIPVVHVQNAAMPCAYAGASDVEPLIPLQDELNTRLSDRAHRVTFQAFKMYLGKGIDDFLERPVGPGQMWATHNADAHIEEFGGDAASPSEDAHIAEARQAMDKVSGVTPLAAGLISGNVGNLTSATALKVVLSGLLARTARKRLTYGAGLRRLVALALAWLDAAGALATGADDRDVELRWSDPLPADEGEQLRNAQIKAALGLPARTVLAELGYADQAARID